jgi:hypothetical protein
MCNPAASITAHPPGSLPRLTGGVAGKIPFLHVLFRQQLCLSDGPSDPNPVCVTKGQLAAVLSQSTAAGLANPSPTSGASGLANSTPAGDAASTTRDTPPVIQINGGNPAIIHIGDSYADVGATITGPQADLNLGIRTYLNGAPVSTIQIDTTQVATDTIQYVATDQTGLTATSTKTVIVRAPDSTQSLPEAIIESNPNAATTSPSASVSAAGTTTAQ